MFKKTNEDFQCTVFLAVSRHVFHRNSFFFAKSDVLSWSQGGHHDAPALLFASKEVLSLFLLVCIALLCFGDSDQQWRRISWLCFFPPFFLLFISNLIRKALPRACFLLFCKEESLPGGWVVLAQTPCSSNTSTTADGEEEVQGRPHRSLQLLKDVVRWGLASAPR